MPSIAVTYTRRWRIELDLSRRPVPLSFASPRSHGLPAPVKSPSRRPPPSSPSFASPQRLGSRKTKTTTMRERGLAIPAEEKQNGSKVNFQICRSTIAPEIWCDQAKSPLWAMLWERGCLEEVSRGCYSQVEYRRPSFLQLVVNSGHLFEPNLDPNLDPFIRSVDHQAHLPYSAPPEKRHASFKICSVIEQESNMYRFTSPDAKAVTVGPCQ